MASISFVTASVFRQNTQFYNNHPVIKQVPCEGAEVVGIEYQNPNIVCGAQDGYYPTRDAAKATADSIKTIHVRTAAGDNFYIIINNNQDESAFVNACNACCGSTPDISTGLNPLPAAIIEVTAVEDATTGNSTTTFGVPINPFGRNITINNLTYNHGQVLGWTPTAGGYANAAAVASALNTNASALGTWTSTTVGTRSYVKLVSSTVDSIGLDLDLVDGKFCLDLPTSAVTIGQVVIKDGSNADQVITIPATVFSEANRDGVLAVLKSVLVGTLGIVNVGSPNYKINYAGQQKLVSVRSADGTTTTVAFSSGVCS